MKKLFLFLTLFSIIVFLSVIIPNSLGLPLFSELDSTILGSSTIQLGLLSSAIFFLWKKDIKTTISSIGFPGSVKTTMIFTILGIILLFAILFIVGILATFGGFNDQEKISEKVTSLPIPLLIFAVLLAPICEELFFRALMVTKLDSFFLKHTKLPHLGVFFSSIIFGLSHLAYGSIVEIIGVFVIGIVLATIFKASKSITPCIIIHMVYNGLSILAMFLLELYL
jgi:membrane protease YdiL (CAAX protease family)